MPIRRGPIKLCTKHFAALDQGRASSTPASLRETVIRRDGRHPLSSYQQQSKDQNAPRHRHRPILVGSSTSSASPVSPCTSSRMNFSVISER
jgi:hypothetical protein